MPESLDQCTNLTRPNLIAIDLDGTLLDAESTLPEECRRLIREAIQSGIRIVIATGRTFRDCVKILGDLAPHLYFILFNGAVIRTFDTILRINSLDANLAKELIKKFRQEGFTPIVFDSDGIRFVAVHEGIDPVFAEAYQLHFNNFTVVADINEAVNNRTVRLGVWNSEDRTRALHESILKEYSDRVVAYNFPFNVWILEVLDHLSNKGFALEWLTKQLAIPLGTVTAIGNHINDIPMLRMAGQGIAVENALPEVIESADLVIPSNLNSGVATYLRRLMTDGILSPR